MQGCSLFFPVGYYLERFDHIYSLLAKSGLTIPKGAFKKECESLVRAELTTIPGLEAFIRKTADEFMKPQLFKWV